MRPDPAGCALRVVSFALVTGLLSGCSSFSWNPANWWHQQEGGKIAQERPPPPGADDAYPNLSTVPAKPPPPDADALKKLTDSLVADRTNAQHLAEAAPIADPSSPAASPSLFGVGTAPPPPPASAAPATSAGAASATAGANSPAGAGPPSGAGGGGVASASMPAASAPPAPATPSATAPSPAPRRRVQSAPLAQPPSSSDASTAAPAVTAANMSSPGAAAPAAAPPPAPPQPEIPAEPPARPPLAGAPPPPVTTPPSMPTPGSGPAATVVFSEGSATLPQPEVDEVRTFAAKRGNGVILVTGFGDAAASDPSAQSAALTLGLSRAQSVADALKQAGVPGTAIRVSAEASGSGASLHLLQ